MKKIKVLEVIRQGEIGGGESHVLDLIQCLDSTKVTPIALAFTGGHMIDTLRAEGITCYVVDTQKAFDRRVQQTIQQIVKSEQIDLIHAHGSRAASNMLWTAKRMKIPFIYTVHGWSFHPDQSYLIRTLRAYSEKLLCALSNQVICVSESNRKTGIETFGLDNADVIENGINLHRFDSAKEFPNLRKEWGYSDEDCIVGQICRITQQKAPIDFLKAMQLAHGTNPYIKGVLIGDGDMKQEVIDYVQKHHMEQYLQLQPFRTDVPAVLKNIDIYCLPSLWEGLSIALLEAMAMQKPVIVTPTDGTKELIQDGVNGSIVPFNNPEDLCQAILRYADNPSQREAHGKAAHDMVEKRFNAQRVADAVWEIYKVQFTQSFRR